MSKTLYLRNRVTGVVYLWGGEKPKNPNIEVLSADEFMAIVKQQAEEAERKRKERELLLEAAQGKGITEALQELKDKTDALKEPAKPAPKKRKTTRKKKAEAPADPPPPPPIQEGVEEIVVSTQSPEALAVPDDLE